MTYKKKTWKEKFEQETVPRIEEVPPRMAQIFGKGRMLIATPGLVDVLIKKIPNGKLTTINLIRNKLSHDFNTDITCPITTGIFTWIIAHKTEEERAAGMKRLTPYWRVIKENGALNPKYPGGEVGHARYLQDEGFVLLPDRKGKKLLVKNFENKLFTFN